jgi:pimeloyl-ACP methyl ester carboxylesterase
MAIIERGSLRVDYIDEGSGPTVVLAHSSVSGNRQWKRLIERLRDRYRVLAPNLFGYGQTTAWTVDGTQTLDDAAEVILAVCEKVDGPVRLVGHSWGGSVALCAAKKLGDKVSHLALYEPILVGLLRDHHRTAAWTEAAALYADVKRLGGAGQWEALGQRFTDYFNGDGAWEATPADRQRAVAALLLPNYFEWDATRTTTTIGDFAGVSARTLLLRGTSTRLVLREIVDLLHAAFPHWQLLEVPGGGHMAPFTHADIVNPAIAEFLDAA